MKERTLILIKPNVIIHHHVGEIITSLETHGFELQAMKTINMDKELASQFYAIHAGKPFYEELVNFMTSWRILGAILEKENAVAELRELVGNTDPHKAKEGTLRHDFGETVTFNAVHASDSVENAEIEMKIIFPENYLD